jgi:hypothetical protein
MRNFSLHEAIENSAEVDDLSLFRGGLFYRLQVFLYLIRTPKWNLPPRVLWIVGVGWLPLVIITLLTRREQLPSLLRDYVVYSRTVIAAPVLLIGQVVMESRFRALVTHVHEAHLLAEQDRRKLDGVIATLKRLRDSALPELIMLTLIAVELIIMGRARAFYGSAWALSRSENGMNLTAAGWYYVILSVPIYQFLVLLALWKWLVWCYLLYRLSRMDLLLAPTHPDGHGGLGFLGLAPVAFIPIAIALSAAIGGTWRYQILHGDVTLNNLTLPAIILVIVVCLFELGPLCFFVPRLAVLRKKAVLEYGSLAQVYATAFHEKWVVHRAVQETETPNVTMLADLARSYSNIRHMGLYPIDKETMISLAAAVFLPLFPAVLAALPLSVIIHGLLKAVRAAPI